jgi:CRP-like cAMP-binding protein
VDHLNWNDGAAIGGRQFAAPCHDEVSRLDVAVAAARKSSWLSGQPSAFVERLLASASLRHHRKSRTIIEFDQQDQGLHFLVEGAVDVCVPRSTGELLPVHLIAPRHWFGELGALTGQRCFAEYGARQASTSLYIPRHAIVALEAEAPAYRAALMELLARAVRHLLWASGDLTGLDPMGRVISKLLTLTGSGTAEGSEEEQTLSISQSELGAACCLSRSTMNLILAKLEKAGLVRAGYRQIVVLRRKGLLAYLSEDR